MQPRASDDSEQQWWDAHCCGEGRDFDHLNPRNEDGRLITTNGLVTIDHVWVHGLYGSCRIYGQGIAIPSDYPALDDDFDFSSIPGGADFPGRNDHFAMVCDLLLPVTAD